MASQSSLEFSSGVQQETSEQQCLLMLLIANLKYNPEQIRVDVYVIPDIAVLADSVIDLMLLPTPHIGCVLEFGVGAKSFISSPY